MPASSGDAGPDDLTSLLSQLETAPSPQPRQLNIGQAILGAISDALSARANVMAGGQPGQGPFAARLQRERDLFSLQQAEADAANRDLRNRIRIGTFETRQRTRAETTKQKIEAVSEVEKARIREVAEVAKQQQQAETSLRKSYIDKILDLGIDTKDVDLLTTSTADLKGIIDKHDPTESFRAMISALPPDRQLGEVRFGKDGSISFQTKSKADKELPVGIISALITAGQDPSAFIGDPQLAAASRKAAEANKGKLFEREADTFLEDVERVAGANETRPDGTVDIINQAIASAASDIRIMAKAAASTQDLMDYYRNEADTAAELVKSNGWSEQDATDYLTRLRQLIKIRFGQGVLDTMERESAENRAVFEHLESRRKAEAEESAAKTKASEQSRRGQTKAAETRLMGP